MQAFIGATLLGSKDAQPKRKPFEIYDCRLPGFTLRVQPSGVRSYYARFGRSRRIAARPTLSCLRKRGRNVGGCWETWHMAATRYTALAGLTV
jgi:hypothetical protein